MEEGTVEKNSTQFEGKSKSWVLGIILVLLLTAIVGLVVWIVHNNSRNDGQKETTCEEMTNEYEMRICLSRTEHNDESGDRYENMLEKSFNDGNYDLFDELILDRASDLVLDGQCEASFEWLDSLEKKYINDLPIMDQYSFYVSGMQVALDCGNAEKKSYYSDNIDKIVASTEYHNAMSEEEKINELIKEGDE